MRVNKRKEKSVSNGTKKLLGLISVALLVIGFLTAPFMFGGIAPILSGLIAGAGIVLISIFVRINR